AHLIVDGVRKGDVRLLAQRILRERKESCRCIRCREIGRIDYGAQVRNGEVVVKRTEYEASGGTEVFLSFEETRTRGLVAYSRLRISNGTARIRELKVFGEVVPIHKSSREGWQHRGYGKKLVVECERIAHEEWDMDELSVTSGVGARGYFRRTGYTLDEPYMVKQLG
ncbi:MAG: tRNA uridine(34) 5-carboxymethylaminomethyl modification radical SAM/GNAT enzyme Elp3, partial [Thermoplasmata archaeon]